MKKLIKKMNCTLLDVAAGPIIAMAVGIPVLIVIGVVILIFIAIKLIRNAYRNNQMKELVERTKRDDKTEK